MRAIAPIHILVLGLLLVWPVTASGEGGESHSVRAESGEEEQTEDDREEAIRAAWSRYFAPPEDHRWELETGLGWNFWDTAYGGLLARGHSRLRLRRLLPSPVAVSLSADASRRISEAGPLEFTDRRFAFSSAAGLHWWTHRWLLGADIEGGVLLQQRTIDDQSGEQVSSSGLTPLVGAATRAGVSVRGTASLSVELGMRWHTDRLDRLMLLQFAWLL